MRMLSADYVAAARLGALRALEAGTTTLADSGPTGAGAAALAESGLRGLVHLEAFGRETGAAGGRRRRADGEGVAALDAAVGPRARIGVSPHAPYTVGPELWAALRAQPGAARPALGDPPGRVGRRGARDRHRGRAARRPLRRRRASSRGAGRARPAPGRWRAWRRRASIAPGLVAAHCVRLGADDPGSSSPRAGIGVAHCPRSNAHLRCGRAPLEALRAAGRRGGPRHRQPGERRRLRPARRGAGLPGRRTPGVLDLDDDALLRLITIDAARALGLDGEVGSLAPGKRAPT